MPKNGKLFETVVQVIQEAFKNSELTIVRKNCFLIDLAGVKREIDILIESKLNNFDVRIAIECKDYLNKVSIEKIEAFHSKCDSIPQINKKIFVSRNGFQSGAKAKAKQLGIDLLVLEKISELEAKNWLQINIPRPISVKRIIKAFQISFTENKISDLPHDILIENEGVTMLLFEFVKEFVSQNTPQPLIYIRDKDTLLSSSPVKLHIDLNSAYLLQSGEKFEISNICLEIEDVYEEINSETSFDKYRHSESDKSKAEAVTMVLENQDVFAFVKKEGSPEIDIIKKVTIDSEDRMLKIAEIRIERFE